MQCAPRLESCALQQQCRLDESFAEWHKGESGKFEMLDTEWDAYDGDTEQYSESDMSQGDGYSADKPPDYIHNEIEASVGCRTVKHLCPERHQCYTCEFQCLQSERNTDNCQHHRQARHHIFYSHEKSAKYNPDNIEKQIHTIDINV